MNININVRANLVPATTLNQRSNCEVNVKKSKIRTRSRSRAKNRNRSPSRSRSKSQTRSEVIYQSNSVLSVCEERTRSRNKSKNKSNRAEQKERNPRNCSTNRSRSNQKQFNPFSTHIPEVQITAPKSRSKENKLNLFSKNPDEEKLGKYYERKNNEIKSEKSEDERNCSPKRNIQIAWETNSNLQVKKETVRNCGNKKNSKKTSRAKKLTVADIPHFEQYLQICDNVKIKQCVSGDVIYKMTINKEKQRNMYKRPQPAYPCNPYGPGMNQQQYYPTPHQYQQPHLYQQPCPPGYGSGYEMYQPMPYAMMAQGPGVRNFNESMVTRSKYDECKSRNDKMM